MSITRRNRLMKDTFTQAKLIREDAELRGQLADTRRSMADQLREAKLVTNRHELREMGVSDLRIDALIEGNKAVLS